MEGDLRPGQQLGRGRRRAPPHLPSELRVSGLDCIVFSSGFRVEGLQLSKGMTAEWERGLGASRAGQGASSNLPCPGEAWRSGPFHSAGPTPCLSALARTLRAQGVRLRDRTPSGAASSFLDVGIWDRRLHFASSSHNTAGY